MGNFTVIRKAGGSRIIAVSKFIPEEWQAIEIIKEESPEKDVVILRIEKVK